jgi:hypothetical protein
MQAMQLHTDLGRFEAVMNAPLELIRVFNALLEQIRERAGDDPTVQTIQPADERNPPGAGVLQGLAGQLAQVAEHLPRQGRPAATSRPRTGR